MNTAFEIGEGVIALVLLAVTIRLVRKLIRAWRLGSIRGGAESATVFRSINSRRFWTAFVWAVVQLAFALILLQGIVRVLLSDLGLQTI